MVEESTNEFNFFKLVKHIKKQKNNLEKKIIVEYKINLFDKFTLWEGVTYFIRHRLGFAILFTLRLVNSEQEVGHWTD